MKLSSLFKLNIKKTTQVSDFIVGKNHFVIIKILDKKTPIVRDKTISYLLRSGLKIHWFLNRKQFEYSLDLISSNIQETIFVIVG